MAPRLIVEVVGDASSLQRALGRSSVAANSFAGRMTAAGATLKSAGRKMTMGMTLPIVGIGYESVKVAKTFQASMELLSTQAGVPQAQIAGLSKSVIGLAGPTATAPDTLAAGLYHLTSQGLRGAKSIDTLRIAAEGAKIGQANLEDVTNALGAAIASGIKGTRDYSQAMGVMNATVGSGDMRMQDLADAMGTGVATAAKLAGVSINDVGAALAVYGDNNIRGAKAGTLLSSALRLLSAPSTTAQKALATVGISAKDLGTTLASGGLPAAIQLLKDKMDAAGMSAVAQNQLLTQAFGGRQSTGVKILVDQLGRLKTKEDAVRKGGNAFASDWSKYTKTAAYRMDQMGASMSAAGISIGNILLPIVSKIVNAISRMLGWFDQLPDSVKKTILIMGGVLAAVGPVVAVIGDLAAAVGFLAANSTVILVGALALLVGGMVAAVKAPGQLKSALEKLGVSAKTAGKIVKGLRTAAHIAEKGIAAIVGPIRNNWGTIKNIFHNTLDAIKTIVRGAIGVVRGIWNTFGGGLKTIARTTWNYIRNTIHNQLTIIKGIVEVIDGLIHGNWHKVWTGIKDIVRGTLNQIKNIFNTQKGLLVGVAQLIGEGVKAAILNPIVSLATAAYSSMSKVATQIGKGFGAGFKAAKGVFTSAINTVLINPINWVIKKLDSILSFHLPSWIPGIGGKGWSLNMPTIPTLDTGGLVTQTGLAVVHRGETFSGVGRQLPGGGGSHTTNIYIGGRRVFQDQQRQLRAHQHRNGIRSLGHRYAH